MKAMSLESPQRRDAVIGHNQQAYPAFDRANAWNWAGNWGNYGNT